MSENYENSSSTKSLDTQKKRTEKKEDNKTSSVKKALNWLFLSEYKE